MELTIARSRKS